MATVLEEFNRLKLLVAKANAKGDTATLNRKIHVIDHEVERARKIYGKQKTTRVMVDCKSDDARKRFNLEKDRFYTIAHDPHIAIELVIRALRETSNEQIRAWLDEGGSPQMEPTNIPDWMKP